jgi:hypothetical protein
VPKLALVEELDEEKEGDHEEEESHSDISPMNHSSINMSGIGDSIVISDCESD